MGDPGRQYAGFASAGAGEDKDRAVESFDRFALFGIEANEIWRAAGRARARRDPSRGGDMPGRSGTLVRIVQQQNSLILFGCKMALAASICGGRRKKKKESAVSALFHSDASPGCFRTRQPGV